MYIHTQIHSHRDIHTHTDTLRDKHIVARIQRYTYMQTDTSSLTRKPTEKRERERGREGEEEKERERRRKNKRGFWSSGANTSDNTEDNYHSYGDQDLQRNWTLFLGTPVFCRLSLCLP